MFGSLRAWKCGALLGALLLAGVLPARAGILRVPTDFTFIGNAVAAAAPRDTIRVVGNGGATYHERFEIDRDITIEGGWRADFQLRDPTIYVSVIHDTTRATNDRRPVLQITGGHSVTLDGLTIVGGQFGIEAEQGANLQVRNCIIRGQRSGISEGFIGQKKGGGLRMLGGSLLMESCTVRDCRSAFSGAAGAFIGLSSLILRDCVITDANAFPFIFGLGGQVAAGGLYVVDSGDVRLARTEVSQCNAFREGGLAYFEGSDVTIVDCAFSGSTQSNRGGALFFTRCSEVDIRGLNDVTSIEFATAQNGGGIYADHVDSFSLSRCRITNNGASDLGEGGGVWLDHTTFSIADCEFSSNSFNFTGVPPRAAGAVRALASDGTVTSTTFRDERVASRGGAWFQEGGNVEFRGCVFENNQARVFGGAVHIALSGSILLDQCMLAGNNAKFGGAASASFTGALRVTRCTFTGNGATSSGAAIYLDTAASATLTNSILCCAPRGGLIYCSRSSIDLSHCDVWNDDRENARDEFGGTCPDPTGTSGNISEDPKFCPPVASPYLLSSTSPCVGSASDGGNMGWALAGCAGARPLTLRPDSWAGIKARYRSADR